MAATTEGRPAPPELLRRARQAVTAFDGRPVTVVSPAPLRDVPGAAADVARARAEAGMTPDGVDHPRRTARRLFAIPTAVIGAVGVLMIAVSPFTGGGQQAVVGIALLLGFGGTSVLAFRYAADDPLRLDPAAQQQLEAACRWQPTRPLDERTAPLLGAATAAAQRLVDSPAWRGTTLTQAGVALPLASELDGIETELAGEPSEHVTTRVAAIVAYTDVASTLDPGVELACEDVEALAFLLSSAVHESA